MEKFKKRCRGEFPISVKGLPNSLSKVNLTVIGLDVARHSITWLYQTIVMKMRSVVLVP